MGDTIGNLVGWFDGSLVGVSVIGFSVGNSGGGSTGRFFLGFFFGLFFSPGGDSSSGRLFLPDFTQRRQDLPRRQA